MLALEKGVKPELVDFLLAKGISPMETDTARG
jgi:hypothetical protein